ncbi:M48 family metallopeptidase [Conchiformibius kuhniae]|uniref:M48 family metallopeptidase n=1 Tax=Conchiformibius kuhniae TaxID=211502 RepID=A0A8T9MWZ6_9NEIS|nr:M48 family metallopeptidase [Conchiformibius kuhniae]UOP04732.1 M48 family metallopeptidase [Conchiformibius kuhniae]
MPDPKFDESRNPNIPPAGYRVRELRQMLVYLTVSVAVLWLLVEGAVRVLPYALSLERERQWFAFVGDLIESGDDTRSDAALQTLADDLARRMDLPAGSVRVYRSDDDTVNAFATFGGHIVLYQGLLDKLPDEESVAAVLAHEIAHVKHRDPLRGASRGLLFALISTAATGGQGNPEWLIGLENLRYSRSLEEAADAAAVAAVQSRYGDVGGAARLFAVFANVEREHGHDHTPQWAQSHPDTAARRAHVRALAADNGWHAAPSAHPNIWRTPAPTKGD